MSENGVDRLYNLLPAVYRLRDAEQGGPLRSLLDVIDSEVLALQQDIDGLYEDWFIETCADWVVPYIGDLVGNRPIHEIRQLRRADVAKTIYYRRRKGTAAMLEEMARDVTGWGAHVAEFFELMGWNQNLNHLRRRAAPNPPPEAPLSVDRVGTVNLRSVDALDRLDGPFDIITHSADIRPVADNEGWHNIRKVGFFLWRLGAYTLSGASPRPVPGHAGFFTFSRLGNMAPLFNKPADDPGCRLVTEAEVPGPIRPMAFRNDLEVAALYPETLADSAYYGPDRGINVIKDGKNVPPRDVVGMDLSGFACPPAGKVAIDVAHGLLGFAAGEAPADPSDRDNFNVTYTYGFSADIGGGPYERRREMIEPPLDAEYIDVVKGTAVDTLQKAVHAWETARKPPAVIRVLDSAIYGGNLDIALPADGWLMIQAANFAWPSVRLVGISSLGVASGTATLIMDGLLIEGAFQLSGGIDLQMQHCTLVPGRMLDGSGEPQFPDRDSLVVGAASPDMAVSIKKSIIGPVRLPADTACLSIEDSIVQAPRAGGESRCAIAGDDTGAEPGPPLFCLRSTILGPVSVRELARASEVIFSAPVSVQRQQSGCVRFSYVPRGSVTPRRFRCQPELAFATEEERLKRPLASAEVSLIDARLIPVFTSLRYGDPGYAQLSRGCAAEIRTGAEDGAEMGAFCSLKQPQREANLRIRLDEYLPYGLEPGLIFVT